MNPSQIWLSGLSKTYRVPVRPDGLSASIKSLLRPTYKEVEAVRDVSFSIQSGEMVGLIGPNGAGKTTTLKMLSGLLHPTRGRGARRRVRALGAQARLPAPDQHGAGQQEPDAVGYPADGFFPRAG